MNLHILCVLACVSLQFALAVSNWEVINDVKPYDDSGTQEDLLSQEDLIPIKASKPKARPAPPRRPSAPKNADTLHFKKVTNAPLPRHYKVQGERSEVGEEEQLLPLGVPRRINQRHLLQVFSPRQGPMLPPEEELKRLRLRSSAVNLSTPCKGDNEDDCLFSVEDFVLRQMASEATDKLQDSQFADGNDVIHDTEKGEKHVLLSRQPRQANGPNNPGNSNNNTNNNNNGQTDDQIDEGSGTGPDDSLYTNQTTYENQGLYKLQRQIGVNYSNSELNNTDKEKYRREFETQLTKVFNSTLPGFVGVDVGEPVLENGEVKANYTVLINGEVASSANQVGQTNVEGGIRNSLQNATIPAFNNLTIFQTPINPDYVLGSAFVNEVLTVLGDYCQSENPCPDAGREYNVSACVNTGFMSGYCPHKCTGYPCQNGAVCELDGDYVPFCNCGTRYKGKYCEETTDERKPLTTGETVGVGVAAAAAGLAFVSCCVYVAFCRGRNRDLSYSYYEDEGSQGCVSDPTSVADFYIHRPVISTTPISVFNTRSFEA